MLMAVRNQLRITLLSIKYAVMREMLNKFTFISNIIFMMLNNASIIVQWVIIYGIRENIGDYTLMEIILLWAFASGTYGIAHFFFKNAFYLSDIINTGKLDAVIIQPKNVLLSVITTDVSSSAIGDLLYGYILLIIYGITPLNFLLYTTLIILGGLIIVSTSIIFGSLSFWFGKSDIINETVNSIMVTVSTYPDSIFKGFIKILLYTIIPVGLVAYLPVNIMVNFNLSIFGCVLLFTIISISFAFYIFHAGLKKYTSTNLMNVRI